MAVTIRPDSPNQVTTTQDRKTIEINKSDNTLTVENQTTSIVNVVARGPQGTAGVLTTTSGSFSGSFIGDGSGLTGVTASAQDDNALYTASISDDTITFTKGGGDTFNITIDNVVSSSYSVTSSYAISSSYSITSSFSTTSSYVDWTNIDSIPSGIISSSEQISNDISGSWQGYLSGSGILSSSDQIDLSNYAIISGGNDFIGGQTITGSFLVTGSTTQIGNNTLTGNTELDGYINIVGDSTLTGSFLVSGSTTQFGDNILVGSTTLTGSIFIAGDIIPQVSASYNLGSADNPWKEIYLQSGSINVQSDIPGEPYATITNETGDISIRSAGFKVKSGSDSDTKTPFEVRPSGRVIIKTDYENPDNRALLEVVGNVSGSQQAAVNPGTIIQTTSYDGRTNRTIFDSYGSGSYSQLNLRRANGTVESPSTTTAGLIGRIGVSGWVDGIDYGIPGVTGLPARIDFRAPVDYASGSRPTEIWFYTTPENQLDSQGEYAVKIFGNNHMAVSGTFTASLQEDYIWVGQSNGYSREVSKTDFFDTTGLISSSVQIASDISGSFNQASASFSTRITTAETELNNTLVSSSTQIDITQTQNYGNVMVTGSISGSTLTFTKGDSSTFDIPLSSSFQPGTGGSGLGWARYDDNQYTTSSYLTVSQSTQTVIPNNSSYEDESFMNSSVKFYNSGSQKIQMENVGDVYEMVVTFKAKAPNANQTHIDLTLTSTGETPYDRVSKSLVFAKGNDEWQNFYQTFNFYADSDFVLNGNQWKITADGGEVHLASAIYFIQRTFNGT